MPTPFVQPPPHVVAEIRRLAEEPRPVDECVARWSRRIPDAEMADLRAEIEWFLRRHKTPKARLDFVRRMTAMWTKAMPPAK